MADHRMVLGIFADEAAADRGRDVPYGMGEATEKIVSRPVGVLVADEHGRIKEHKLGARPAGEGAGIGLVLAVIAPPSLLVGMVGGGVLGHFYHKGLGLDGRTASALPRSSRAARPRSVSSWRRTRAWMISNKLTELGGAVEVHEVTEEALEAVAAAAPAELEADAAPVAPEPTPHRQTRPPRPDRTVRRLARTSAGGSSRRLHPRLRPVPMMVTCGQRPVRRRPVSARRGPRSRRRRAPRPGTPPG